MRHYQTKQIAIGRSCKANQFRKAKRYTLLLVLFISALSKTNAQTSGLRIAASYEITYANSGELRFKSNLLSAAVLRKLINEAKIQEIIATKDPIGTIKKEGTDNIKKNVTIKEAPIRVVTTSGTIYDIPGSTAAYQYTSLQASFKFVYEVRGLSAQQVNAFNAQQSIELYKLEKGDNTRSFCIPSGSCTSVNIPIQITGNGLHGVSNYGGAGAATGKGDNLFTIVIPSGYLAPGEYAFIDKSSLTADGNSLKCFAFTVR